MMSSIDINDITGSISAYLRVSVQPATSSLL